MSTYDFPIRRKFVPDCINPVGMEDVWPGWNLPQWKNCAEELEKEGIRAIICSCGLTGTVQNELSDAVDIPIFASTFSLE
jgi:hypothetical protein